MTSNRSSTRRILLGATALAGALALGATQASAQERRYEFDVPAQPLNAALQTFARQAQLQVIFAEAETKNLSAPPLNGSYSADEALQVLLAGTELKVSRTSKGVLQIAANTDPQSGSAAGDGADQGTVQALIVTAQKREEDIQDVPIAISAFSQEDLTRSQVAGGPDLITQVPNMTFTKTNFSSYSIQLRGIGTQAISATTDPGVAVAFNNTPFTRNRFFEQEFYDLQRVEVLRGPQGTLYGRNATAGVVNIISAKPKFNFEAKGSADVSNYNSSRVEGMVNIPLVEDAVALRLAGAWTKRDGYAFNELTGAPIDGRDLWSTRLSLRVTPSDRLDVNLIWEHFQEDDDRLRSAKQLCKKDVVTDVAGFAFPDYYSPLPSTGYTSIVNGVQATFSQGCARNSLYAQDSFQRPNGLMLPYYVPLTGIGLPTALRDPYSSVTESSDPAVISTTNDQPEDLRVIQSTVDPTYRAKNDLGELQVNFDLADNLTLSSETAYANDMVYSLQDFNRFNTAPGAWLVRPQDSTFLRGVIDENGVFCDPQLGCSDRLVAVDISTSKSRQFSQELRLGSNFDGPFNFSVGANYLRGDSEDKYYVFINSISLIAADSLYGIYSGDYVPNVTDNAECLLNGYITGDPAGVYPVTGCTYMDPNPIDKVNDQGHNYFLSKNPYKLISYAVFGETYYNVTDNLKVTAGLRWTVDKKEAPRVPTWILISQNLGYPVAENIRQEWREPTGRLAIDWKPHLAFTDETLVYASYAHGYKAGGANPPGFVRAFYGNASVAQSNSAESATRPKTFNAEFVDAYELGSKNTLAGGRATLNLAAFYYDYKDYQISEIVDRSAFNRNFDATVWGVELEANWRPVENLRIGLKGGYEKTRIADGEEAIDLMDRTAGDSRWLLVRPFPTFASSCILPAWLFVGDTSAPGNPELVNLGGVSGGNPGGCELAYQIGVDPASPSVSVGHDGTINYTNWSTDPNDYPGLVWPGGIVTNRTYPGWDPTTAPNGGEGIAKSLGGNELPNAPHWTATITGDYSVPLPNDWLATLHTDLHWQSQSWWRVFNDHEYDKLHPYFTMNLAAIFTNEEAGWNIMAYIKNVTDETAITGAFLNSDDTGLTTNVFLTEPRLYGLRVTKAWSGGSLVGSFGQRHDGPYPFTIELDGQIQRHDAPNAPLSPTFEDQFAAPLDIFGSAQEQNLDWGDGRGVRVTWRPEAGPWSVSAALRRGRTNHFGKPSATQYTDPVCVFGGNLAFLCSFTDDPNYGPLTRLSQANNAQALVNTTEDHELVDFAVSYDIGIGQGVTSRVSGGLRYVNLKSITNAELRGVPDWHIGAGSARSFLDILFNAPATHTVDRAIFDASREFEGLGPTATWDAAYTLLGSEMGHLDVDWSLTAGAIFGDQTAKITGTERSDFYKTTLLTLTTGPIRQVPTPIPTTSTSMTLDPISRTKSVTVPMAGASLGLTYKVDRFSIGAGYRWERYFDAIDGGFTDAKKKDRTIDGPYFKLAVGFGG